MLSEKVRHKRPYSMNQLHEMSTTGKSRETESRLVVDRDWLMGIGFLLGVMNMFWN